MCERLLFVQAVKKNEITKTNLLVESCIYYRTAKKVDKQHVGLQRIQKITEQMQLLSKMKSKDRMEIQLNESQNESNRIKSFQILSDSSAYQES